LENNSHNGRKNEYPRHAINNLKEKLTRRKVQKEKQEQENEITQNEKWITLTYYSPQIRRITSLFKNTNIQIAFRTTNTIQQQLNIGKLTSQTPMVSTDYSVLLAIEYT